MEYDKWLEELIKLWTDNTELKKSTAKDIAESSIDFFTDGLTPNEAFEEELSCWTD